MVDQIKILTVMKMIKYQNFVKEILIINLLKMI